MRLSRLIQAACLAFTLMAMNGTVNAAPPATRSAVAHHPVHHTPALTTDPVTGTGMWITWMSSTHPDGAAMIAKAQAAGLWHIYVRVASSANGFYGKPMLDALLPLAHQAGISVIGWFWMDLRDTSYDASLAIQAADYTPNGSDYLDALAPDIEEEPIDQAMVDVAIRHHTTPETVALNHAWMDEANAMARQPFSADAPTLTAYFSGIRYGAKGLQGVGQYYLMVGATFPNPDLHGEVSYATISTYCQAFAPMAYWRAWNAYTGKQVKSFIRYVFSQFSKAKYNPKHRPLTIVGQAFTNKNGTPSYNEVWASLIQSENSGALGESLYEWFHASPDEWQAISDYGW